MLDFVEFVGVMTDNSEGAGSDNSQMRSSITKLRTTWKLFDLQGTGEVGAKEFRTVLRSLGLRPTDAELNEITAYGSVVVVTEDVSDEMKEVMSLRKAVEDEQEKLEVGLEAGMEKSTFDEANRNLVAKKVEVDAIELQVLRVYI